MRDGFKKSGLTKILKLFKKYHTMELSLEKAHNLIADAKNELAAFADGRAKEALITVADYTLLRRK